MYIRRRPVMHFLGATLLAVAAAAITATGPLMVLNASFDISPRMLLGGGSAGEAPTDTATTMAAADSAGH